LEQLGPQQLPHRYKVFIEKEGELPYSSYGCDTTMKRGGKRSHWTAVTTSAVIWLQLHKGEGRHLRSA
jgi:hypothetical protein